MDECHQSRQATISEAQAKQRVICYYWRMTLPIISVSRLWEVVYVCFTGSVLWFVIAGLFSLVVAEKKGVRAWGVRGVGAMLCVCLGDDFGELDRTLWLLNYLYVHIVLKDFCINKKTKVQGNKGMSRAHLKSS